MKKPHEPLLLQTSFDIREKVWVRKVMQEVRMKTWAPSLKATWWRGALTSVLFSDLHVYLCMSMCTFVHVLVCMYMCGWLAILFKLQSTEISAPWSPYWFQLELNVVRVRKERNHKFIHVFVFLQRELSGDTRLYPLPSFNVSPTWQLPQANSTNPRFLLYASP